MPDPIPPTPAPTAQYRFRLLRFYTLLTLPVVATVLVVLFVVQQREETFFAKAQREQAQFFAEAQAALAQQNEQAARASLLAVHESGHVNLTRLVANTMWDSDFGPLVAAAQRMDIGPCRTPAVASVEPGARRACFAEVGRRIQALPGFKALDRKAYAAVRASTVFKVKVFDLRGITVYSSEHAQIGEDASNNLGWRTAAAGQAASELTHRDRFSAFEGVVENRDLISSYVPVRAGPDDAVVGVFELYSDVTPFLAQIQAASHAFADNVAANEASVERTSRSNIEEVGESSDRFLLVVGGLIVLLYGTSLVIVRVGQRLIDRQTEAQAQAALREQRWHREKMAALSAMAANVSHEVGNPLTVIACLAQMLPDKPGAADDPEAHMPARILEQTQRIAQMMRKISDFASPRSDGATTVDLNAMLDAVCDFQSFDQRYRRTSIQFTPVKDLPACELVPDHLNEVMMNLLQATADVAEPGGNERGLKVTTHGGSGTVAIELACYCPATGEALPIDYVTADPRLDVVRRRVADMKGRLDIRPARVRIDLPALGDTTP